MLSSFRTKGLHDIVLYDKFKEDLDTFDAVLTTDMLFLTLPTKLDARSMMYDLSAIHDVCAQLHARAFRGLVVLKSTVLPGTTAALAERYAGLRLLHNPEFLSAATAARDFHEQGHIVIGAGVGASSRADAQQLGAFYAALYPSARLSYCTCAESEAMKVGCNAFYAVKIQFFNELHALCERQQMSFAVVRDLMLQNGWIHAMHTQVPGHDGRPSFGGECLPKDTRALATCMRLLDTPHHVVTATIEEQAEMRDDREHELA